MSVVRLYFDADSMERAVVPGLRARGIDATTALEVGMADSSDENNWNSPKSKDVCCSVSTFPTFSESTRSICPKERRTPASSWPPSSDTGSASGYADCIN